MRYKRVKIAGMCVILFFTPSPTLSQEPLVIPRLTGPVVLDGISDEPAWEAHPPLPGTMHLPTFGAPPSEKTEFLIGHDDDYLYVAGRLYDTDPAGIQALSLKRDNGSLAIDYFMVLLDTFNDKENALLFATSPAGTRTDMVVHEGKRPNLSWDTFWDVAVRQNEEGWFAEMRIPFSSLRFQDEDGQVVMGVIFRRNIARKNEQISYPAIPPSLGLKPSQARELVLEGVHSRKPLHVTSYVLGGMGQSHSLNAPKTGYDRRDEAAREVGLDLKYGLTSNLTLDLTLNTDFAQVEADDQQVNLSRFSLFFPERRRFFQERSSVFDYSTGESDRLFHSRRIGLSRGEPVRIHGGGRLVGRIGSWDIGLLDMQTAASEGSVPLIV
jgi:hypothetical protein